MIRTIAPLVAVAALILVALWLARNRSLHENPPPAKQDIAGPIVEPREEHTGELPRPTLIAYSRAIGNQQCSLEQLLDHHARILLPEVPDPENAYP